MLKHWKKINTKVLFHNPWWTYMLDRFEIPNGITGEYHYVHTNGSSMVIPIGDDGEIILVNQFRYLCGRESLEFPCGSVKDGMSYLETAQSELEEEAGYRSNQLELAGEFNPYNGVTSEICRVFIASKLEVFGAKPDDTEEFELMYLTPEEIDVLIRQRNIWDGMTLAAWILAREDVFKRV